MNEFLMQMKTKVNTRVSQLQEPTHFIPNTLPFCDIFKRNRPAVIAEIKFASPSQRRIYHGSLKAHQLAMQYVTGGAAALSVLTEPYYFKGDITYLRDIKNVLPQTPLLQKDFICSEKQIIEGLQHGASAILLIVAFLEQNRLTELHHYAKQLGLTVIVEVHNHEELDRALKLNPEVIGVNNRNLNTLTIDLTTSRQLKPYIPSSIYTVCESGIHNATTLKEMTELGFNGFLIGTSLMSHEQPGEALRMLLEVNNDER